jgi:hypothetical protein
MITPILENLVIQGLAEVMTQTVGQNGVCTISVPDGKSIVITDVNVQPFIGANTPDDDFAFAVGSKNYKWSNLDDYIRNGLLANWNSTSTKFTNETGNQNSIIKALLLRGIFQIELSSIDKQSVLTYSNEYKPVNIGQDQTTPDLNNIAYLPTVKEHQTNLYSVHKNNVHIKLRFFNDAIQNGDFQVPVSGRYVDLTAFNDVRNSIPESRPIIDINSPNMFFQAAVFSNILPGNTAYGYYPFGVETNYNGTNNLGVYNSNNFVLFPYNNDLIAPGSGNEFSGLNGELGLFNNNVLNTFISAYAQLFVPYINITYVLINHKPDGNTLVPASKYNSVTVSK